MSIEVAALTQSCVFQKKSYSKNFIQLTLSILIGTDSSRVNKSKVSRYQNVHPGKIQITYTDFLKINLRN